jgi:DNA-binding winged helix-turn-helix (wHTH) protein
MSPPENHLYEFEPFVLDVRGRILLNNGVTVRLTPRAFQILLVLVRRASEVVDKDQLMKEVWSDIFVEEANLSRNIYELRKALGDDPADPRYIETIPKVGYRFIAPMKLSVIEAVPSASSGTESGATIIEKHTFARVISETVEGTDLPVYAGGHQRSRCRRWCNPPSRDEGKSSNLPWRPWLSCYSL